MSVAEEVRTYCIKTVIAPARSSGIDVVRIRAGDVHGDLGYQNRLPAVVSAIGSNKFCEENGLTRIAVEGPLNGANTVLVFRLN